MDKDVHAQTSHDQREHSRGDFAVLFDQLDRPDAVAPMEGGLMRLLGTINAAQRQSRGKR